MAPVATGETADPCVPEVDGLETFSGRVLHSTRFKSGKEFRDERVLVVGSGNSGMEVALDLSNHGANASIVVRSPMHIMSRWMMDTFPRLLRYMSREKVDSLTVMASKIVYGDLSKYGIERPKEGPFMRKAKYGKYPVLDLGTCNKIKFGHIQVLPAITKINGNEVLLANDKSYPFDAIIFTTGFKTSTNAWLKEKGDDRLLGDDGISRKSFPNHWKGENGLYCAGLWRSGFYGIRVDANNIANDVKSLM